MKSKNMMLFKIITFLVISIILLSNFYFVSATNNIIEKENIITEEKDYCGSLNLKTGEIKKELIEHNDINGKSYSSINIENYSSNSLNGCLLAGPNNETDDKQRSIIGNRDDRQPIPNQWRTI